MRLILVLSCSPWILAAACHVDPLVSSSRSSRTTSVQPSFARWYKIEQPMTPPPMTTAWAWVFMASHSNRVVPTLCVTARQRLPSADMRCRFRAGRTEPALHIVEPEKRGAIHANHDPSLCHRRRRRRRFGAVSPDQTGLVGRDAGGAVGADLRLHLARGGWVSHAERRHQYGGASGLHDPALQGA